MNDNEKTERLIPLEPVQTSKRDSFIGKKNGKIIVGILCLTAILLAGYFAYRFFKESQYQKNLDLGMKYMEDGDYTNALISFKDAAKISQRHVEIFPLIADAALDKNDYASAHQAYEKLIEVADDKVEPTILNARVYVYEGDNDQAHSLIDNLAKENPDNPLVSYAKNTIDSGNLAENLQNFGNLVYDYNGNTYFISEQGDGLNKKEKIYRYNIQADEEPEVIIESSGNSYYNLNLWNNKLYYLNAGSLKSCDLNGKNETTVLPNVEVRNFYIYQNQFFLEPINNNQINTQSINTYSIDGSSSGTVNFDLKSSEECDDWLVYRSKIYFFTFDTYNNIASLYELDPVSGKKTDLADYTTSSEMNFVNGLYPYNDTIYISLLDGDNGNRYYAFDLNTGKNTELDLIEYAGLTVNDKYLFLNHIGENDMTEISVYDLSSNSIVQTIKLADYVDSDLMLMLGGAMTIRGENITPNNLYCFETLVHSGSSASINDVFKINLDDFSGSLLISND